jgi:F0F1-type ATP synthase assembly protein I
MSANGSSGSKKDDGDGFSLEKAARAFQDNVVRAGPVASASYALIGALILLGGIGYAIDRWLGTTPWFLLAGLLLGLVVGFYELAKAVWPRQ